jgi:hypothetical protein
MWFPAGGVSILVIMPLVEPWSVATTWEFLAPMSDLVP